MPEINRSLDMDAFLTTYVRVNAALWQDMAEGRLDVPTLKVLRLQQTFTAHNLPDVDYHSLAEKYLDIYSSKKVTLPGTYEILAYLKPRYPLGVLSNGFTATQKNKLRGLGLQDNFDFQLFSEEVGAMKPARKIFDAAIELCGYQPDEVVYIGDAYESDIVGAKKAGWFAIHYTSPEKQITNGLADHQIYDLMELQQLFPV
jgi:putative hydrolase of the HAD superfamily